MKPSAYDNFVADQSPANAVRLAIADHRDGSTDWPFIDALHLARDICEAHARLVERCAELEEELELSRDQTRRQGEISRQTLESVQAMDGLHKRIVQEGVETHHKLTTSEARCAALSGSLMELVDDFGTDEDPRWTRARAALALKPEAKP